MHINFAMWRKASWPVIHAFTAIRVLNNPRPAQPPPNWPTWFSGFTFSHNRQFGGWLILGLIADTLLHVIPFTAGLIAPHWPPIEPCRADQLVCPTCSFLNL